MVSDNGKVIAHGSSFGHQEKVKFAVLNACISAYARLQELERKRNGGALFVPLNPEEHDEYARLRFWWEAMGPEKQIRLVDTMRLMAKELHLIQQF